MTYDYFYGLQADQFSFYRVPKALFTDAHLCGLSTDAKLLYGILLDRMYLSARNGWQDKESRVYIIFTIDEIKDSIRCAEKKAIKLFSMKFIVKLSFFIIFIRTFAQEFFNLTKYFIREKIHHRFIFLYFLILRKA